MTVWLLFLNRPFEGEDVVGVFTTRELAEAAGRELPRIGIFHRPDWSVEEYGLQGAEDVPAV